MWLHPSTDLIVHGGYHLLRSDPLVRATLAPAEVPVIRARGAVLGSPPLPCLRRPPRPLPACFPLGLALPLLPCWPLPGPSCP
eukprot:7822297-Lingulodinium_polyedra.AAC.1